MHAAWRADVVPLENDSVHVWRVRVDRHTPFARLEPLLSVDERERAGRFHFARDRNTYTAAHGALREILGGYLDVAPAALQFTIGHAGKPALSAPFDQHGIQFNLSHSGEIVLIAVARHRAVGVDVERWDSSIEHLALAEQFFSSHERLALASLASVADATNIGFFQAWSRKEAYLKATGAGITEGLHHFDVSLRPGEPAELLADRTDAAALHRWQMSAIDVGSGYSGALVAERPMDDVVLLEHR